MFTDIVSVLFAWVLLVSLLVGSPGLYSFILIVVGIGGLVLVRFLVSNIGGGLIIVSLFFLLNVVLYDIMRLIVLFLTFLFLII